LLNYEKEIWYVVRSAIHRLKTLWALTLTEQNWTKHKMVDNTESC
jgi:hypothetical protein